MNFLTKIQWKLGNFIEPYGLLPKAYYRGRTAISPLLEAALAGHYPLAEIDRRYARYQASEISITISRHDDMYVRGIEGNLDHYLKVGRAAIDLIVAAMVASGRPRFDKVLDLPCGAGRVTRHLKAMFPDAIIFVSELDKRREDFVVETLDVRRAVANPEFEIEPTDFYDLVFVGSLITHLDAERAKRAIAWFCRTLAPGGLAILTTHGRRHDEKQRMSHYIDDEKWESARNDYHSAGFGFAPYPTPLYGMSVCSGGWLLSVAETLPGVRVLSFQEAAWDDHQDVIVLQRADERS